MLINRLPLPVTVLRRPRLGVSGRFFLLQLLVLTTVTLLLTAIEVSVLRREAREELGARALATSRLVAQLPQVIDGAERGVPTPEFNAFVNRLRQQVGADFIVVGNRRAERLSHPLPERLGKPIVGGDTDPPLRGQEITGVAQGTLGVSVRGLVPVRDASGRVVGLVLTGYLLPQLETLVVQRVRALTPWFLCALAIGAGGSILVARLLKRDILDFEPEEIASLVQQHRAVLAALREGVVAVRADGMIVVANDWATTLLGLSSSDLPYPIGTAWPQLAVLVQRQTRAHNLDLRLRGLPVLVNVEPLEGGGYVASIRDRREVLALAEELTQVRGFVDVLRAQTHEHLNRVHTIVGLLQLGKPDVALRLLSSDVEAHTEFHDLLRHLQSPRLVALLVGKRERAQELGVELQVEPGSSLSARWDRVTDALVTAVGNLTENAFEAFRGRPGTVRVLIGEDPEGVQIEVLDDGPGVPPEIRGRVFEQGVSSKGQGRGYGLANVHGRVTALGGSIRHFRRDEWTVFQVNLPASAAPAEPGRHDA